MNNNEKIQLIGFSDGIREFGNLYGCLVRQEGQMVMVGSIAQRQGPKQAVFMFPESELENVEKVIAKKGSLYDLHVLQVGATQAKFENEFELTVSFITESDWTGLDEQQQKAFQIAQRYRDGIRTPDMLANLLTEDGEQLYRSTSLVLKGYRRDDLYTGKQILEAPKVVAKAGGKGKGK